MNNSVRSGTFESRIKPCWSGCKYGYVRYENLPLETRDKKHIAVEFVCNVYPEGNKKVIQCNIRDITKRKEAEDEIQRFNAELEERVAERTVELEAFSHSVSHDLRSPLRGMSLVF